VNAWLDLYAAVPADAPVMITPGSYAKIPTGITLALPPGTEGQVRPRSGLAAQHGVTLLNTATAAAPLAEEISTYPGVRAANARLAGVHQHPELHIRITVDDRASLSDLRHRIDEVAVPRLVGALDLPALDADLLLRPTGR